MPLISGGTKQGGATVYLKVRPAKLSDTIWLESIMEVNLHKLTYGCIVGNDYVISCRDNVRHLFKHKNSTLLS